MPELVVWRCPDCGHEIQQNLFGTPHTSGIACIECETSMERIPLEEASYDFDEELVESDGHYEYDYENEEQQNDIEDSPFEPVDQEE